MEIIGIKGFGFQYPGMQEKALDDISISIKEGSFHVICGSSGCGKTTLLRNLKPEIAPYGESVGEITIKGESLLKSGFSQHIGFVMQSPDNQIVTDTVWHEMAFGLENMGLETAVIRRRVAETANFFGINEWFEKSVHSLSGGQKQILCLASIMAMQPKILLLDEPTAQLDPIASGEFLQMVKRINQELGTTVIMSEHRLENTLPLCDHIIYMEKGQVGFQGETNEFILHMFKEGKTLLLPAASRIFFATKGQGKVPVTVKEGREYASLHLAGIRAEEKGYQPKTQAKAEVSAKNLWFSYEKRLGFALRGAGISFSKGEIASIVGGNGSGKSTLLMLLAGVFKPLRGTVKRNGNKVALLPQFPKALFEKDTVEQELKGEGNGEIIRTLGIEHLLQKHPYDLSGGEMQKAALCKILLSRPQVLLLDEPTKGLDVYAKHEIGSLLRAYANRGMMIALVTHDLEFAAKYTDVCHMMFLGDVVSKAPAKSFFLGNHFYTTSVNRITRGIIEGCVTLKDVIDYEKI